MAEKPIKTPLPADLPEDWNIGQTVAPDGTAVGLTEQHGYNYLMAAVNRAQRGVNEVNEAFGTVSGKRTCRFVVGTSTAGWTEADCDYLCDGVDDQVEIQQAINTLPEGGGEIVLLSGNYQLSADVSIAGKIENLSITGEPGSTILSGGRITTNNSQSPVEFYISGIVFKKSSVSAYNTYLSVKNCSFENSNVYFYQTQSDIPGEFLCIGNRFLLNDASVESTQIYCYNSTNTPNTNIVISNNTIITNEVLASRSILVRVGGPSGGGGLYTISGNAIRCISKCYLFLQAPGTVTNNFFHNCDADLYVGGNLVGNQFFDCDARVDAVTLNTNNVKWCASVSGNTVENGTISVSGNVEVTGNAVNAGSTEKEYAIRLRKLGSNAAEDQFPVVVGNYVANGKCGILLEEANSSGGNNNCKNAIVNSNRIYGSQTPIKIGEHWSGCMVTDNLFTTGSIEDNGTDNIVRFNSDDPSTGGGTAGVTTFNGRSGKVVPGNDDYTAPMVGAIPASAVKDIQSMTQSQYDALASKNATTLYLIKE
ncbi:MAG: hypothetical protein HDT15_01650 [Oscillibacter sp.]|nr:hypothetical protein [Oscillibacter sp.]